MKKGDVIAVYGTLRKGQSANGYFDGRAKHLGKSRITAKLYNLGWFPTVKLEDVKHFSSEGPTTVVDLYEIEDDNLPEILDGYEGYPRLFDRKIVEEEGGRDVWVYEYVHEIDEKQHIARLITSGDWEEVNNNVTTAA